MLHLPSTRGGALTRICASFVLIAALVGAVLVPAAPAAAAGECGPSGNVISCENTKLGTSPDVWDIDGAGDETIQGFSTDISVNVGSTIDFKIDTDAPNYTIDIYRTGWYQGLGARKVTSVTPLHTPQAAQPACITDSRYELTDCGTWSVSASWAVPSTAVSGVYVALLTRSDTGGKSHITFVVRNQSSHSAVLFQTSDPTWQAYNPYGGADFYEGAENGRAYKISYNRPIATREHNKGRDFYFSAEYPLVRFLEKNGYDVSYFSGVDTDRYGSLLTNHEVFLSVGHDEYWSTGQRANVEAARDAGLDLQFLSGNEAYWHTRYEPSADLTNTPYRTLVSYKETWASTKIDPSSTWTGTWRDPRFASPANGGGLPENALTGTAYMANDDDLAVTVTAAQGKMRMWRNTGLAGMTGATQALAPHTIGYESDEDLDNGFRPSGLVRMSATTGSTPEYLQDFGRVVKAGTTTHNLTLYRAESGALVFGAGTIQWTWGLDQTHDGDGAPADTRMQQAQVNLLADMGAQPTTLVTPLVAASASTDETAPTVVVTSPAAGATVPNGTVVNLTGTASDVGGLVAGVNVSTDGGETWHPATGTTSWSYSYVQHGRGITPVQIRAVDDSGNYSETPKTVSFSVTGPYSILGLEVPKVADSLDAGALQLGLRFTPTTSGYISGVRFYKSAANVGTHTGTLWSAAGVQLATVTFANETATGWQSANFTSPYPVTAGTPYVISYYTPSGHYAVSSHHWISRGSSAPPMTVAGGYNAEPAGVFASGATTFPDRTFTDRRYTDTGYTDYENYYANYYVDAIFDTVDTSPLVVTTQRPIAGSTSLPVAASVSATFSKPAVAGTVTASVTAAGGAAVAGTTSYDAPNRTVTFQPSAALAPATTYTVTIGGTDALGNGISSGGSWTFTTAKPTPAAGVCPCSLYGDGSIPQTIQTGDTAAVTLGVRFTPAANGTITAIKFYKAAGNTGTHVAALWDSANQRMIEATFQAESSAGWQTVTLPTPVQVTAGSTYTASYRAPVGGYSATSVEYANGFTRGPLTVPANGGVYSYADAVPTAQTSTSYSVDVEFQPAAETITLVAAAPGNGTTLVPRSSVITAQLSRAVAPGYALAATSGGSAIAGATTLSSDGTTITLTPASPLPNGAVVQVSLAGVVSTQGATLATQNWSFTTVNEATTTLTNHTLFDDEVPQIVSTTDTSPVELGVSFSPSVAGSVTAIRFYKGAGNGGAHVGSLWNADGTVKYASVNFVNETATGWQTAQLSSPVALTPGQTYVVSYFAPQGRYPYTSGYFAVPSSNGPLTAGTAQNGRFSYAAGGGFPTLSYNATNYFVDVVYTVASTGGGTPPTTPTVPTGTTLFGTETPSGPPTTDTGGIELGMSFSTSVAGSVTGIRFYKGPGNGGAHVGHLWAVTGGPPLATVAFSGETSSGWQAAALSTPVALTPGETYVVSYFAPQGRYSAASGYFTAPKTSGPLTAGTAQNGRFLPTASGGFPEASYGSSNYYVDVFFTPAP